MSSLLRWKLVTEIIDYNHPVLKKLNFKIIKEKMFLQNCIQGKSQINSRNFSLKL